MPVEYTFNPFDFYGIKEPESSSDRNDALDAIADLIQTSILESVGNSKSPLMGYGKFPGLSKEYKKFKSGQGLGTAPNLEFEGDLLESLIVERRGDEVFVGVSGDQDGKADGHNNHSGQSKLPLRRFIPSRKDGDEFNRAISGEIKSILRSFREDE